MDCHPEGEPYPVMRCSLGGSFSYIIAISISRSFGPFFMKVFCFFVFGTWYFTHLARNCKDRYNTNINNQVFLTFSDTFVLLCNKNQECFFVLLFFFFGAISRIASSSFIFVLRLLLRCCCSYCFGRCLRLSTTAEYGMYCCCRPPAPAYFV